jgi:hypothetical protein
MDKDIESMSITQLQDEAQKLRDGIRAHRDQKDDDNCFLDDQMYLYGLLPEKIGADPELPNKDLMMLNCSRYYECRKAGKLYQPLKKFEENRAKGQTDPEYVTVIFNTLGIEEVWSEVELGKWISSQKAKRDSLESLVRLIKSRQVENVLWHQSAEEAVGWIQDWLKK